MRDGSPPARSKGLTLTLVVVGLLVTIASLALAAWSWLVCLFWECEYGEFLGEFIPYLAAGGAITLSGVWRLTVLGNRVRLYEAATVWSTIVACGDVRRLEHIEDTGESGSCATAASPAL